MAIQARLAGSGVYRLTGSDRLGVDVQYFNTAAPSVVLWDGAHTFAFPRTKSPTELAGEITALGLAFLAADAQVSSLNTQFPVASTFIQIS